MNNVVLKCHRCGKSNHKPSDCRFLQATCHSCGKKGHISPVCLSASHHWHILLSMVFASNDTILQSIV